MRNIFLILNTCIFSKFKADWYFNFLFFINCIRHKRPYYLLNLKNPKTFNEKINFLKEFNITEKSKFADKLVLKNLIKIDELNFPKTFFIFSNPMELKHFNFKSDLLENGFVIKSNHGSGMNVIFQKGEFPSDHQISRIMQWFTFPSHLNSREEHYNHINKKVFIEELLESNIKDYKIHSFHGIPQFIQIDSDRFSVHKRDVYTISWNILNFEYVYSKNKYHTEKPELLNKLLTFTDELNKLLNEPYIRYDFYLCGNRIYLGEITFHPEGGVGPFDSYESDKYFGSFLKV